MRQEAAGRGLPRKEVVEMKLESKVGVRSQRALHFSTKCLGLVCGQNCGWKGRVLGDREKCK